LVINVVAGATATPGPTFTPTATPTATQAPTPTNTPTPTYTPTPQTSYSFAPDADSYVDSSKPNNKYGTNWNLRSDTAPDQRRYLHFSVQGLTTAVTSATLRIYARANASSGYRLSQTAGGWTETGITYNNKPATGAPIGNSGAVSSGTWTQVDVTPLVTGNSRSR
jgi:hypothetical protein